MRNINGEKRVYWLIADDCSNSDVIDELNSKLLDVKLEPLTTEVI